MDRSPPPRYSDDIHPGSGRFVGRERELGALGEAFEAALAGTGQLVLIAGEPGIGKTRTAQQFSALATAAGARVLWGSCFEWDGAPPYWPWVQVLREQLRRDDPRQITGDLGDDAATLAQILPEMRAHLPNASMPFRSQPEQNRYQFFAAVGSLQQAAAARQVQVIVLDDLHWADLPSVLLLQFLVRAIRESRVLVVATYRDIEVERGHPLASPLAALAREPSCRRLRLRGLRAADVGVLIEQTSGRTPPPRLVNSVWQETEGNPFFVVEVVRLLADEGALDDLGAAMQRYPWVPDSVREVVARRLARLSEPCRRLLAVAAVLGREFSLGLLGTVAGRPSLDVLDILDEGIRAQLIVAAEALGRYRFSHALVQETLYGELSSTERVHLHLAIGRALEETTGGQEPPYAELAHHFYHAAPAGVLEKVVAYASRAGDQALGQLAWEQAVGQYRHALDALDLLGIDAPEQTCDLLLALGEAQNRSGPGSGDVPDARASFLRASEIARRLGDASKLARAAVGYAGFNIVTSFGGAEQVPLLEEALAALGDSDDGLRVRVLGRLAIDLYIRSPGDFAATRPVAAEAVERAGRLGDRSLLAFAYFARHFSTWGPDSLDDCLADSLRMIGLADGAPDFDLVALGLGYLLRALDLLEAGDVAESERMIASFVAIGERTRISYFALRVDAYQAMLALVTGRYDIAEPLIVRAKDRWQSSAVHQHQDQLLVLLRDLGRLDEFVDGIAIPRGITLSRYPARAHRMLLLLETGRKDEAQSIFESLAVDDFGRIPRDYSWLGIVLLCAEVAAALGDRPRAARLYELLQPYEGRNALIGLSAICHGPVSLALGPLAGVLRRWGDAERHLDNALSLCERTGMRPFGARAHLARATLHSLRNAAGDREQGLASLERADTISRGIGMVGLYDRIAALRDSLVPPAAGRYGLTPRELDVLRLVAGGLTDAEAAERLFLSRRTVGSHLNSIYSRLGVSSRTAAVRFAVEHELI